MITIQDYARLMGMPLWAALGIAKPGDTSCGPLDCDQIEKISAEIEWAESVFEEMLAKYDKSLIYRPKVVQSDTPYIWLPKDMRLGDLATAEATADVTTGEGETFSTLTFQLAAEDFDPDCDEILAVDARWPENSDVATRMQPRWKSGPTATEVPGEYTLTTDTMAIQEVACADGTTDTPETIDLVVTILRPSEPRLTYYSGGCPDPVATCAKCGGKSSIDGCYIDKGSGMWGASFDAQAALCACKGRVSYYEFDAVVKPVDTTVSVMDAIVSLANTRGTVNECADCTQAATDRVKRDLGILPSVDLRTVTLYAFSNPFGIYAPGALSAWRTIERLVAGVGGAGVM